MKIMHVPSYWLLGLVQYFFHDDMKIKHKKDTFAPSPAHGLQEKEGRCSSIASVLRHRLVALQIFQSCFSMVSQRVTLLEMAFKVNINSKRLRWT